MSSVWTCQICWWFASGEEFSCSEKSIQETSIKITPQLYFSNELSYKYAGFVNNELSI